MTFLVAAFVAVWLLVLIYVLYMTQLQRGLEQDLRSLEDAMTERSRQSRKA